MWARKLPDRPMVLDVQCNKASNSPKSYRVTVLHWLAYPSLPVPPPLDGPIGVGFASPSIFRHRADHRIGRPIVAHIHCMVLVVSERPSIPACRPRIILHRVDYSLAHVTASYRLCSNLARRGDRILDVLTVHLGAIRARATEPGVLPDVPARTCLLTSRCGPRRSREPCDNPTLFCSLSVPAQRSPN